VNIGNRMMSMTFLAFRAKYEGNAVRWVFERFRLVKHRAVFVF